MNKSIAKLLVLMMVLGAVLIAGTVAASAEDETTANANTWNGLWALFDGSFEPTSKVTTVVLDRDIICSGSAEESGIERVDLPKGRKITLDMNGHTIDGAADVYKFFEIHGELDIINSAGTSSAITNFQSYAFTVYEGGKLTINDGVKISGNCLGNGCTAVYTKGAVILNGCEISGNSVVDDDVNTMGAAVVVDEAGTLTLKGDFKFADNLTANKKSGEKYNCDVLLMDTDARIVIPEELKVETPINVGFADDMVFTNGWAEFNKDKNFADYFAAARTISSIALDEKSGELKGTVKKAANKLSVKGKSYTVKYKTLKKKTQTIARKKVLTVSGAKGTVTYTKASGNKKITVSKKNGNITVKKGLKKGTYKVKVSVKAAGTADYEAKTIKKTVTIKVK